VANIASETSRRDSLFVAAGTGRAVAFGAAIWPLINQMNSDASILAPRHGSIYDVAARVRQGPATYNLVLPPYTFMSDTRISIG
jgi:Rieske Fe-S protein